ncbi:hypothetical protein P5V15_000022 [Pogonomyrmex californicus]
MSPPPSFLRYTYIRYILVSKLEERVSAVHGKFFELRDASETRRRYTYIRSSSQIINVYKSTRQREKEATSFGIYLHTQARLKNAKFIIRFFFSATPRRIHLPELYHIDIMYISLQYIMYIQKWNILHEKKITDKCTNINISLTTDFGL